MMQCVEFQWAQTNGHKQTGNYIGILRNNKYSGAKLPRIDSQNCTIIQCEEHQASNIHTLWPRQHGELWAGKEKQGSHHDCEIDSKPLKSKLNMNKQYRT